MNWLKFFAVHVVAIIILSTGIATRAIAAGGPDPIAGQWQWDGAIVEIWQKGGAHMSSPVVMDGKWRLVSAGTANRERSYVITWNNGQWIDAISLSMDHQHVYGQNQIGWPINANRISGATVEPGPKVGGVPGTAGKSSDTAMKSKLLGYWCSPRHDYVYKSGGVHQRLDGGGDPGSWNIVGGTYYEDGVAYDIVSLTNKEFAFRSRDAEAVIFKLERMRKALADEYDKDAGAGPQ